MSYDFKRLSDVSNAESVSKNTNVIIEEDGVIKKVPKDKVGGGSGGVQVASTAKVGQTIVVKSVDENGNPTEWECVDKDAQPDWSQDDATASDYIKNRTHYKYPAIGEGLMPNELIDVQSLGVGTHLIFKSTNQKHFLSTFVFSNMRYGNPFGFSYEYEFEIISTGAVHKANISAEMLLTNTLYKLIDDKNYQFHAGVGMAYVILDVNVLTDEYKPLFPEIGIYLQVSENSTMIYHSLTLQVFRFSKISESYIPDTIARTADVVKYDFDISYNDIEESWVIRSGSYNSIREKLREGSINGRIQIILDDCRIYSYFPVDVYYDEEDSEIEITCIGRDGIYNFLLNDDNTISGSWGSPTRTFNFNS